MAGIQQTPGLVYTTTQLQQLSNQREKLAIQKNELNCFEMPDNIKCQTLKAQDQMLQKQEDYFNGLLNKNIEKRFDING